MSIQNGQSYPTKAWPYHKTRDNMPDVPVDVTGLTDSEFWFSESESEGYRPTGSSANLHFSEAKVKDGNESHCDPERDSYLSSDLGNNYAGHEGASDIDRVDTGNDADDEDYSEGTEVAFETKVYSHSSTGTTNQGKSQHFSEFEIAMHPNIAPFPHLIIRRDYLIPSKTKLPRKGRDGHLCPRSLSEWDTMDAEQFAMIVTKRALPTRISRPVARIPRMFRKYATMVFLEDPTKHTSSGEVVFEYLGNFYLHKAIRCTGGKAASFAISLEFVEDPFVVESS